MFSFKSTSPKQTKQLAKELALFIVKDKPKNARPFIVLLKGELGAGKTTFTQGFMRGLGISKKITSPTFVLMKHYPLKARKYSDAYHIDCYRIKTHGDMETLDTRALFKNPKAIILIEWPERIKNILPKQSLKIYFDYGKKESERIISLG